MLQAAGDLAAKVIVSCSLPMDADDTRLVIAHTSSGAEELQKKDAHAKDVTARLIRDVRFEPVDAGPLRIARYIEPFTMLVGQLAYEGDRGPALAYRFEWFEERQ